MSRQQAAHVLQAEVALEQRLREIAQRRRHRHAQAEHQGLAGRERADVEGDREHERAEQRGDQTSEQPFDRLVGTDGREWCATELTTDEEPAHVVEHGAGDRHEQDAHTLDRHVDDQRRERAEHTDVHDAEQGDADVGHRPGRAADSEQEPEDGEDEGEEEDEGHGRLAPPVGGDGERHDRGQAEQRGGTEPAPPHGAEELDAGEHDDGFDQDHRRGRAELEQDDGHHRDGHTHERRLGDVPTAPSPIGGTVAAVAARLGPGGSRCGGRPLSRRSAAPWRRGRRRRLRGPGLGARDADRIVGGATRRRRTGVALGHGEIVEGEELLVAHPVTGVEGAETAVGGVEVVAELIDARPLVPDLVLVTPAGARRCERRPPLFFAGVVGLPDDHLRHLAGGRLGPVRELGLARGRLDRDQWLVAAVGGAGLDGSHSRPVDAARIGAVRQREPQRGGDVVGRGLGTIAVLRLVVALAAHGLASLDGLGRLVGIDDAHPLGGIFRVGAFWFATAE